jgi:hypothetical protein
MKDYKQQAKEMAKARLEKMGGKSSDRVDRLMRADGGRACKAIGGGMDEPDGDEFDSGAEMDGEGSKPRLDKPSRGGGKTTVNIIVGKGQEPPPAPMAMPMPPPPPPGPPPGPAMGPPPGGLPMRASGGRMTAGSESGEGRLQKAAMARKHK